MARQSVRWCIPSVRRTSTLPTLSESSHQAYLLAVVDAHQHTLRVGEACSVLSRPESAERLRVTRCVNSMRPFGSTNQWQMDTILLQDWCSITSTPTVAQSAHDYLDIGHYEDLVFTLQVTSLSIGAQVTMNYETSVTQEGTAFLPMVVPFAMVTGLRVDRAFFATAITPPARYVRWRLSGPGTSPFSATFRIWVAAYSFAAPNAPPIQCKPACG